MFLAAVGFYIITILSSVLGIVKVKVEIMSGDITLISLIKTKLYQYVISKVILIPLTEMHLRNDRGYE
jgi:hypothetical protein